MPGLPGGDWFAPGQPDPTGFVPVAPGVPPGSSRETALELPKVRYHLISASGTGPKVGYWDDPSPPVNWVMVWVPRHATLTPRIINIWHLPSRYIANGRSEFTHPVRFSTLAGVPLFQGWTLSGGPIVDGPPDGGPTGLPDGWYFGPYYWEYIGNAAMNGHVTGGAWTNTGISQFVMVANSASPSYAGFDCVWSVELTITGGVFGIPPLRQRARADGLTSDTRQQRDSNSSPQRREQWWVGKYGSW